MSKRRQKSGFNIFCYLPAVHPGLEIISFSPIYKYHPSPLESHSSAHTHSRTHPPPSDMPFTPAASPSVSSTELYSPSRAPVNVSDSFEVFAKCKELMNSSIRQGRILNWVNRSVSKPLLWMWPLNDSGEPFPATQLDFAFKHFEFTPPCCPCNTQDPDPHVFHFAKIWVVYKPDSPYHRKVVLGCQGHYTGCGIFVPLEKIHDDPRLLTTRYPRRHTVKLTGLPGFDPKDLLQPWETDPTLPRPQSLTPSTPSPPSRFILPTRTSGFNTPRGKKRTSGNIPAIPFLLSSPKKTRNSPSFSDNEVEQILSFPSCAQPRPNPTPSSSPVLSEVNSMSFTGKESAAKRVEPSERWFGDTSCLFEPPEPHYAIQKNADIPPLAGDDLLSALAKLNSGEGLVTDTFWRLYDKCDCSLWIRKDMLKHHLEKYCPISVVSRPPAGIPMENSRNTQVSSPTLDSHAAVSTPVIHRSLNPSMRHPKHRGTVSSLSQTNETMPLHSSVVPTFHSAPNTPQRHHHHYSPYTDSQGEPQIPSGTLPSDVNSGHSTLMKYLSYASGSGSAYFADEGDLNVNEGRASSN